MHGCRLARQTPLESGLQVISKNAQRLSIALAHAVKRSRKRRHEDRAEEQRMFRCQSFLVSVLFVVGQAAPGSSDISMSSTLRPWKRPSRSKGAKRSRFRRG